MNPCESPGCGKAAADNAFTPGSTIGKCSEHHRKEVLEGLRGRRDVHLRVKRVEEDAYAAVFEDGGSITDQIVLLPEGETGRSKTRCFNLKYEGVVWSSRLRKCGVPEVGGSVRLTFERTAKKRLSVKTKSDLEGTSLF